MSKRETGRISCWMGLLWLVFVFPVVAAQFIALKSWKYASNRF